MKDLTHVFLTQDNTKVVCEDLDKQKFNAPHHFKVINVHNNKEIARVDFQEGATKEVGVNGVFNEDLIAMVLERLYSFQESDLSCTENEMAIYKLEEALMWLRKRQLDRIQRNVQGTMQK